MTPSTAAALTRLWTRAYTFGLPGDVRAARRAEIESDLWESLHDPGVARPCILPRLAAGVIDDVRWRTMQMPEEARRIAVALTGTCVTLIVMTVWLARSPVAALLANSVWLFPLMESLHVFGVMSFVGLMLVLDLRLLDVTLRKVPVSELVLRLLPWAAPGAVVALVTGLALFVAESERLRDNALFEIKIAALVGTLVNFLVFQWVSYSRIGEWDTTTPPLAARLSACASLVLWTLVTLISPLIPFQG